MKHSGPFLLVIFAFGALAACSAEQSSRAKAPELTGPTQSTAYQENSCAFTFEEGRNEVPEVAAAEMTTTFFRKRLDLGRIKSVAGLSMRATSEFMVADGVDVYHVPLRVPRESCSPLASLRVAPSNLTEIWRTVDSTGDTEVSVLGLYLPTDRIRRQGATRPAILVRPDTDHYTLIHEYAHFLFDRERERVGRTDSRLFTDIFEAERRLDRLTAPSSDSSDAQISEYVEAWSRVARLTIELTETYGLEEMTIEALLTEAARANLLEQATAFNRMNSMGYIRGSAEKVEDDFYQKIDARLAPLLVLTHSRSLDAAVTQLRDVQQRISANRREMENIKTRYATGRSSRARMAALHPDSLPVAALEASESVSHNHSRCGRLAAIEGLRQSSLRALMGLSRQ